jgi:hypothetical protein
VSHAHGPQGSHASHGARGPRRSGEGWSLLQSSLGQRLAGVGVILAGLWLVVLWALQS